MTNARAQWWSLALLVVMASCGTTGGQRLDGAVPDGGADAGDVVAVCGDGVREGAEACDDGDTADGDGCSHACTVERGYVCTGVSRVFCTTTCGDGEPAGAETCDDGATVNGDGCSAGCTIEPNYRCWGRPSVCALPRCGDGWLDAPETCDDGNNQPGDGCTATCTLEGVISEVEPNDTTVQADTAPVVLSGNAVVLGRITEGVDEKDLFRVTLAEPTVVRFEVFEGLVPGDCPTLTTTLRVFDAVGVQLATDNVSGVRGCSAIVIPLAAGNFYVQVEEEGTDRSIPQYALQVSLSTAVGSEVEPNDGAPNATLMTDTLNRVIAGDHMQVTDSDMYAVTVREGGSLRAEIIEGDVREERCESSGIDSKLTLYGPDFVQIGEDDDSGRGFCSLIDGTGTQPANPGAHDLHQGVYYLQVRSSQFASVESGEFIYRLAVLVR
jgi:cysteine-rich repeat protein